MVVAKNNSNTYAYASYGNTAYDYKKYDNFKERNEKNRENIRQKNKSVFIRKLKLIGTVALMLCAGMLIVGRYVLVMNMNSQCTELKKSISENQKKNEELNITLMQFDDIKQIEKIATTELNMIQPDSSNIVHINIKQADKTSRVASDNKAQKQDDGFIGKIVSFFN